MKKIVVFASLLAFAIVLVSCGGSKSDPTQPLMPNIAGAWEFILTSNTMPGYTTGLEAALQEGQTLDMSTGTYVYTGQISASSSQISFVGFTPTQAIVFGGNCAPAANNTGNSLTGSISGVGGSMNFTFTENGNVFTVNAILDASGQSIDSGTYTAQSGSACTDSGTISSGAIVPKLSGMYTGKLTVNGSSESVTATLSESSGNLTANLLLNNDTSLTLTGPVTGNAFFVQGSYLGSNVAYYGYYDQAIANINGEKVSPPVLYFSAPESPSAQAGLLTFQ